MYGSEAISRSMSSTMSSKDVMMVSDLYQQQQSHSNGGLTRYRSAPSSFLASLMDGNSVDVTNTDPSSHGEDEAENMFSTVMNFGNMEANNELQFSSNLKQERLEYCQKQNGFSSEDLTIVYETSMSGCSNGNGSHAAVMENQMQVRMNNNGNCSSNLIRQSSSPAGFFSGFEVMRAGGSFGGSKGTLSEANSTSSGLSNHMNFTPPHSSFMPGIAQKSHENIGTCRPENGNMRDGNNLNGSCYIPGFPSESWNDSATKSLKRNRDGDFKMFSGFNGLENQNADGRYFVPDLAGHVSLAETFSQMGAVGMFLRFQQDVIPCKIRAKRGCATHPRSIAERMRRTRISQRMKKLQELFPDMDKQANTADMLDLAVEYIKDLQKQVQTLTDIKAKCVCVHK